MSRPPAPDAQALDRAAGEALRRGDFAAARRALDGIVARSPGDAGAWYGLAIACRGVGDHVAKLRALDRVLAIDPGHLLALMMKGDHFAEAGDGRSAKSFYQAVVSRAPPSRALPAPMREMVGRAAALSARYAEAFEVQLMDTLARSGFEAGVSDRRFSQAVDLMLGRKQVFLQSPSSLFYPELPHRQFFERAEFPWLAALEARTGEIRGELEAVMALPGVFPPYVENLGQRPPGEFGALRDNPDWGACYLIKAGAVQARIADLCPITMAALGETPLCAAPGRTPSLLFSLLRPGTRIPPHNGQINTRLICHLPLIAPPGCALRVGNETRPWVEGETLIFDDSIEHEAWNDSRQTRVVLLFEIWRPELSVEERALVSALLGAVSDYDRH